MDEMIKGCRRMDEVEEEKKEGEKEWNKRIKIGWSGCELEGSSRQRKKETFSGLCEARKEYRSGRKHD